MARTQSLASSALSEIKNTRANCKARADLIKAQSLWINDTSRMLKRIGCDYIWIDSYAGFSKELTLHASMRKLDGFKAPALVALLSAIVAADYTTKNTVDYAESISREYRFEKRQEGVTFSIVISATVRADSDSCRKVQTGTTVTESATYTIICD